MMTVKEVSKKSGVTVRALHHYDAIGLLRPTQTTEAGYRLYDDKALERLQMILLYRELQFSLEEIKGILDSSAFDRNRALEQQVRLLELQKEHIENLIAFARGISMIGVRSMDFSAFDSKKLDEYRDQAKAAWGKTPEYREFEEKARGRSKEEDKAIGVDMMVLMSRFGAIRHADPAGEEAQALVEELRSFINEHFYTCGLPMLQNLGAMYAGGGSFTENIDAAGGEGTGAFIQQAIGVYCTNHQE